MVKLNLKAIAWSFIVLAAIVYYYLFGDTGLIIAAAAVFIFLVPFFLILGRFELDLLEKILFSAGIGFVIFPTMTYYLYFAVGSFKISALVSFLIFVLVSLMIRFRLLDKMIQKK